MRLIAPLSLILLAGCAGAGEPMQVGPDTYSISAFGSSMDGPQYSPRHLAIKGAGEYCRKIDKEVLVSSISASVSTADVVFKCLSKGDSELVRPDLKPAPDILIQSD